MALREFTDRDGATWRVWDITPEHTHPATRTEDYLQGFLDGWLVFERVDSGEKRRLYPLPARWESASDADLERICHSADPVRSAERSATVERQVEPRMRTFTYPGGQQWTVMETPVQYRDAQGNPIDTTMALRFSSGSRTLDLLAWPRDWATRSEQELCELLWRAFPRAAEGAAEMERRRQGE